MQPIIGINNVKHLSERGAMVLKNHLLRKIEMRPDSQKSYYSPSDEFTITLHAHEIDYTDLGESMLWFKISVYDPENFAGGSDAKKIFANGVVSIIRRLTVWCGTQELEDLDYYNIHVPSELEGHTQKGYFNERNLMNASREDDLYVNGLHIEDENSIHGSYWSRSVWVQIPLACAFSNCGFIPVYQMANKIKLKFRLADQHEVWMNDFDAASTPNGPYGLFTDANYCGGGVTYGATDLVNARRVTGSDWNYRVDDVVLETRSLTTLSGGALDAEPFEIWTTSTRTIRDSTIGSVHERVVFQIKKSSINKAKFLFVDPHAFTSQRDTVGDIGLWLRASPFTFDQDQYNTSEEFKVNHDARYMPWIDWYSVSLGSVKFPTPTGAGTRNPVYVDDNVPYFELEADEYFKRNIDTGDVSNPSLKMRGELNHGAFHGATVQKCGEKQAGFLIDGDVNTNKSAAKIAMTTETPFYEIHGTVPAHAANAAWFSNSLSLYSGESYRLARIGRVNSKATAGILYSYVKMHNPGGKCMFFANFGPINKANIIQGIDTEMFDIMFEWTRHEKVDATTEDKCDVFASPGVPGTVGTLHPANRVQVMDRAPDILGFFVYDIKLTVGNGIITIDDYFSFFWPGLWQKLQEVRYFKIYREN